VPSAILRRIVGAQFNSKAFSKGGKATSRKARTLTAVDYLLGVSDIARQGDLRFALTKGGEFQHPSYEIPKRIELPKLLNASKNIGLSNDEGSISYLLKAGSASLGGARPKAAIRDDNRLYIAKFPHRKDSYDVIALEWIALRMAEEAGINCPKSELLDVNGQHVLLLERFDRNGEERIGYIRAMTLLLRQDGEDADYMEIAASIRDLSANAADDLAELYRRIRFSLAVNNTDDHLRNHGFLRDGSAWRLSPVFDVNPDPDIHTLRQTSVFGEVDRNAATEALIENVGAFGLTKKQAEQISKDIQGAMRSFGNYAARANLTEESRKVFSGILHV